MPRIPKFPLYATTLIGFQIVYNKNLRTSMQKNYTKFNSNWINSLQTQAQHSDEQKIYRDYTLLTYSV